MTEKQRPDRNLALELVRTTEAAALAAARWMGRGDKNGADGAAVDAMRVVLDTVPMDGLVVIGEGEKDEAPMLFNGEKIGDGSPMLTDIAVDPIDGTTLTALGRGNAIAVIAVSERGTMFNPGPCVYMEKIAVGPECAGVNDIDASVTENLRALAAAKGKSVGELRVAVLNRPRHEQLIADIREAGAGTRLISDGDVAGGINAARYESRIDMCVGIGGSPEGITTACAIKALGGFMQGVLAPGDDAERARGEAAGLDCDKVYELDELVRSDNTFFVATGVTDGELVDGVRKKGPIIRTESIVLRGRSGTIRRVVADHLVEKWLDVADR